MDGKFNATENVQENEDALLWVQATYQERDQHGLWRKYLDCVFMIGFS